MTMPESQPEFEQLPTLYQRWVARWLPDGIPREQNATCMDCAMCAVESAPPGTDIGFYERSVKCCSYFPDVPNFLVGRALAGDNPGAAALRAFIDGNDERFVATLRQVHPNTKLSVLYDSHGKQGFGRDKDLLCPYAFTLDESTGPLCGIWGQRNGVCSTFFCKHGKGQRGFQFWQTLRGLLTTLEWSLSWWAIAEILERPEAAYTAGASRVSDRNGLALLPDAWRHWTGSRSAFYEACAARVESLSPDDVIALAGTDARLYLGELKGRYSDMVDTEPPARLRAAPFNVLHQDGARATVQALTCAEPFEAPAALLPLLRFFEGRPTETTLGSILEEQRVRLDPKLVRRLYDFGILELAPEAPMPPSDIQPGLPQ